MRQRAFGLLMPWGWADGDPLLGDVRDCTEQCQLFHAAKLPGTAPPLLREGLWCRVFWKAEQERYFAVLP